MTAAATPPTNPEYTKALGELNQAERRGLLSKAAIYHLRTWLTEPAYRTYLPDVQEHLHHQRWKELEDAFWTEIPFGTGGRRGKMYPIGTATINDRTIGESAQGLADYVKSLRRESGLSCAIAYDTRHHSRHFAELCAEVMAASGFLVYFLDGFRSTPELSFAVRHCQCACGIMITASHNPPTDNAVKAYWSNGGQLLPPHDSGITQSVRDAAEIRRIPFSLARSQGKIRFCQGEIDAAYTAAVVEQASAETRPLKILYSPLHGVGTTSVIPVLVSGGFSDVTLYVPQASPDGDFPNVPDHVANPENPAVFEPLIAEARKTGADLALASDPDADRLGLAAPLTTDGAGPWKTLTGNQIGALLTHFLLERRKRAGQLTDEHYVVKTLVTSELPRRIADAYGVQTRGNYQVGFKYIAQAMDEYGTDKFVLGMEESEGYLVGNYARDKDAAVAALMVAELAAELKANGVSLHERLAELYRRYGYHAETQFSLEMGNERRERLMTDLRQYTPDRIAGFTIETILDYATLIERSRGGAAQTFLGPRGNLLVWKLSSEGCYIAIRPSGTEPKVKCYLFTYEAPKAILDWEGCPARHTSIHRDLQSELRTRLSPGETVNCDRP